MNSDNDTPVLEFNRDLFYCNQFDLTDINCTDYNFNTNCSSEKENTDKMNCELCKNKAYKEWYNTNPVSQGNYLDINEQYQRSWIQTINLVLGIVGLSIGVYYSK